MRKLYRIMYTIVFVVSYSLYTIHNIENYNYNNNFRLLSKVGFPKSLQMRFFAIVQRHSRGFCQITRNTRCYLRAGPAPIHASSTAVWPNPLGDRSRAPPIHTSHNSYRSMVLQAVASSSSFSLAIVSIGHFAKQLREVTTI